MDLKEIGREVLDWVHLTQDAILWREIVNGVMKFLVL
jgi:hypothetical protein